jgi:hypothetical protein
MIGRVAVALASAVLVGTSLAGCSHPAVTSQVVPAAPASIAPTVPTTAGGDSSLQDVQGDLNAADSATANADGDVSDADSSAATNDSP